MPGMEASAAFAKAAFGGEHLSALFERLRQRGYHLVGPTLAGDAVVYDAIGAIADLPVGWGDQQDGGHYRLRQRGDGALFGYTLAPQGWKRHLYPPRQKLFGATRSATGFAVDPPPPPPPKMAFIGVRACELAAMAVQDKVFGDASYGDSQYLRRRADSFIVAVQCAQAGGTCFCTSMGSGPEVAAGFDIKLVELEPGQRFLAEAGSPDGAALLADLSAPAATADDDAAAAAQLTAVRGSMGRQMDGDTARDLQNRLDHPRWDDVAKRCLTCGNCTMVCPTCFCTTVEDTTDLKGDHAERWRLWDSCFSLDFSYIHGGAVRTEAASRYRQWISHKLSNWHDQFGSSGCVGCGRCITWCPVGIDITAEVKAISDGKGR